MIVYLLILLIVFSLLIFIQDFRDREVHLIFLIGLFLITGALHFLRTTHYQIVLLEIGSNFIIASSLILGIAIYFKLIRKLNFYETIGLGDLLLFLSFVAAYDIQQFVINFSLALLSALLLHLILKSNYKLHKTVPLAGYMALYLAIQQIFETFISL